MLDVERLQVYAYATVPEAADYVAIMRLFTATLLAEWSANDLVERGVEVRPEVIDARLRFLAGHGNLIESPREVRVSSIAEYQRQPARYAVSAIGAVVHRQVEEVLAASGGAREVPRELLAAVAAGIDRLVVGAGPEGGLASADVAEFVTTIFLQFEAFATAIADFYSYVGAVLARPDLDGDEWLGFKSLLLDYLETIVRSVALHTPNIRRGIERLDPMLDDVLARVDATDPELDALRASADVAISRARGRSRSDWEELRAWFGDDGDRAAGAAQLRAAAGRAVGTLLVHLKRLNAASSREESMRRHLLRLAGWFSVATPADAHDLFTAAFGLHGARHLGVALDDEVSPLVLATASWWTAPAAPVPVSLVERGDRTSRGRTVRVADHSAQRARLLADRQQADAVRRSAIAELAAAADHIGDVRLSSGAFAVLLELLASAATDRNGHTGRLVDGGVELSLERTDPRHTTVVQAATGALTMHGQRPVLVVTAPGATEASA